MMNLIQRFFKKDQIDRSKVRANFNSYFFSLPEHNWILQKNTKAHFERLFQLLPVGLLEAMMGQYPVSFVPSQSLDHYRRPGVVTSNTVVVFPEFQKLLKSDNSAAVAYLAHELAFLIYELEENFKEPMMAEVEADKFVCDLGLDGELEKLLLMLDETVEKRLRLTYLTINHFVGKDN